MSARKASGSAHEIDLSSGVITILEQSEGTPRRGKSRGPLDAVPELGEEDVEALVDLLLAEGMSGPTVDALAQIDHPRASAAVEEASRHHLSVDVRLAAAEALHARGHLADLEPVLVRELHVLNRLDDGLARVLRLAEAQPTAAVKQALLWASWNQTDCAPDCARLLLRLAVGPDAVEGMASHLADLGLHRSYFARKAAFDALCQRTGMRLDPS